MQEKQVDFKERFKGRTTVIGKEGILGAIKSAGVPIEKGKADSPMNLNTRDTSTLQGEALSPSIFASRSYLHRIETQEAMPEGRTPTHSIKGGNAGRNIFLSPNISGIEQIQTSNRFIADQQEAALFGLNSHKNLYNPTSIFADKGQIHPVIGRSSSQDKFAIKQSNSPYSGVKVDVTPKMERRGLEGKTPDRMLVIPKSQPVDPNEASRRWYVLHAQEQRQPFERHGSHVLLHSSSNVLNDFGRPMPEQQQVFYEIREVDPSLVQQRQNLAARLNQMRGEVRSGNELPRPRQLSPQANLPEVKPKPIQWKPPPSPTYYKESELDKLEKANQRYLSQMRGKKANA